MRKYSLVFAYLKEYKLSITSYIICTVLSIVFGVVSLGMLFPFLQVLFDKENASSKVVKSNGFSPFGWLKEKVGELVNNGDHFHTLAMVCMLIIVSIILKNAFLYLASRSLLPVKNKVATRFRIDIFNKVLSLPIGYFTEQRKGDLISRMTTDVGQVEGSVLGALEGWVKDPLQIIINLIVLFTINAELTIIILFFIPIMGFFIGRVGRSLKKPSGLIAKKNGESISILDETLGGLRVIKAFNVENTIRKKFFDNSNNLLKLIFNATPIANIADNAATAPLTNLYVALHTADPGAAGTQSTSEIAYTSYARVAVARTTGGWTASAAQSTSPVAAITFPAGTGGAGTATFFSVGIAV